MGDEYQATTTRLATDGQFRVTNVGGWPWAADSSRPIASDQQQATRPTSPRPHVLGAADLALADLALAVVLAVAQRLGAALADVDRGALGQAGRNAAVAAPEGLQERRPQAAEPQARAEKWGGGAKLGAMNASAGGIGERHGDGFGRPLW